MTRVPVGHTILLIALCATCACRSLGPAGAKPDSEAVESVQPANLNQHVRNNCASLLYDLLNDEKNVDKLLIIKRESDELHQLVKDISTTADEGAKKLEQLAKADRTLDLHAMGLPSGEVA